VKGDRHYISARKPSLFERVSEKVILLVMGPLDRIPALYARWWSNSCNPQTKLRIGPRTLLLGSLAEAAAELAARRATSASGS